LFSSHSIFIGTCSYLKKKIKQKKHLGEIVTKLFVVVGKTLKSSFKKQLHLLFDKLYL